MTKSIHHGAFRCWKVLLQPVDSASFYTVHTVCVCTKPAAASLPVRGLSHTRTMRLKDLLHLKDCCRLRRPPRPLTSDLWTLNSELWSLCSDLIKDWAGRGGIWRVRRARWHPTWTLKSGLNCCFSALCLCLSSAFKDYSDLWQLGFHFCSFCNQHVNGLNLGTQKQLKGSRKIKLLLLLLKVCSELGPVWKIRKIAKSEEIRGVDLHHVTWLMSPASLTLRQVTRVNVVILTKVWSCACVSRKSLLPRFNQSVSGAGSVLVPPLELNDVI